MPPKLLSGIMRSSNAYQSLRPLTVISFLSLAPFKFHINSDKKVETSKWFFVIGIMHFLFYVFCAIDRVFMSWFIILLNMSGFFIMFTNFIFAMSRRQKLVRIIQNNLLIDELLENLGAKMNYQRTLRFTCLVALGMVIFNGIFFCIRYGYSYLPGVPLPPFVSLMRFMLPQVNITILVFTFFCIAHLTQTRFRKVNEILQDIRDAQKEQNNTIGLSPTEYSVVNVSTIYRQSSDYTVKQLSNIHSILCNTCQTIEEYFTYPLLVTIAVSVLIIITDDFYILDALMTKKTWTLYFLAFVSQMLWCSAYVLLVVESSCNTINESTLSANIVHDILNVTEDAQLKDRLLRLSLQLIHRKVNFTAAGMFSLDRTLLFTIAGAATCYLIILMQTRAAAISSALN